MRPQIAVVYPNTLALVGMKTILQNVMPMVEVDTFGSLAELEANHPESYFHYFVATAVVLRNRSFFLDRRNKTIVLTVSADADAQLGDFHCLCVNQPEHSLIKSLLQLEQSAHAHGRNLPPVPPSEQSRNLSDRELQVMSLIVQGHINKEIADILGIGLSTVVTHRKNVMDKLGTDYLCRDAWICGYQ